MEQNLNNIFKNSVIDYIIKIEGGYVNNKNDSGGETRYGITVSVARANGYKGSMKKLPISLAKDIYEKKYWNKMMLDRVGPLSKAIAFKLADMSVNLGVSGSTKILQRTLNFFNYNELLFHDLKIDGEIGKRTIHAIYKVLHHRKGKLVLSENNIMKTLNGLQMSHYVLTTEKYKKNRTFSYGWTTHRID